MDARKEPPMSTVLEDTIFALLIVGGCVLLGVGVTIASLPLWLTP